MDEPIPNMAQPQAAIFPMMTEIIHRDSRSIPGRRCIVEPLTPNEPGSLPGFTRNANIK
jgi:hypothetical protein